MNTNRISKLLENPKYNALYLKACELMDSGALNILMANLDDYDVFKSIEDNIYIIGCNKSKTYYYMGFLHLNNEYNESTIFKNLIFCMEASELHHRLNLREATTNALFKIYNENEYE